MVTTDTAGTGDASLSAQTVISEPAVSGSPALDFMRFGASLLVILSHLRVQYFLGYGEVAAPNALMKSLFFFGTRLGIESVLLFFVLSGFLVGGMSVDRQIKGSFSFRKFASDRIARIYTPLIPALVIALLICVAGGVAFSPFNFLVNVLSLQGVFGDPFPAMGALWSLSYEVWFYILCGVLLISVRRTVVVAAPIATVVFLICGFVFSKLMIAYLFVWVAGALSFFIQRHSRPLIYSAVTAAAITAGVVLMQLTSQSEQADLGRFRFLDRSVAILVLGGGFALLMPMAARLRFDGPKGRRLAGIGAFLAGFSYSLYLIHLPIEQALLSAGLLHRHAQLSAASLTGYLTLALGIVFISFLFHLCFERHTPRVRAALLSLFGGSSPGRVGSL